MNATSQARLDLLHPILKQLFPLLCQAFDAEFLGWHLELTQGGRSYPQQHALYCQGRLPTAQVNLLRQKVGWASITDEQNIIVTNAAAGESWHNFFAALDCAPESPNGIDWDGNDEHWAFIVEAGEKLGLISGLSWRDEPHFQVPGVPLSPTQETRVAFSEGGLPAVWAQIPPLTAAGLERLPPH